jgi:DNA-binding beta-propeller fold protein YncE
MKSTTSFLLRAGTCAVFAVAAAIVCAPSSEAQGGAPKYEVDLSWPKPLPDRWVIGGLGGLCVDAQDHVLILNRQDILEGELNTGHLAPPLIELDPAGKVVNSWGDPNLLEARLHSCHFDKDNNVWIGSAPSGMVQKYSHDGSKLLLQIGKKGVFDSSDGTVKGKPLNSNAARFFMPSSIFVDRQNGDVYVSDGEGAGGNRRIAVMDRTGNFLRQWQPEGMQTVHCMTIANDGLVYVCNRQESRIQVYDKMGRFLKNIELPWKPYTAPKDGKVTEFGGAVVALDFSPDSNQRFIYVINQNNAEVEVIDRQTGKILSKVGNGAGRLPGQFDQPHGIAVDSKGNIYVAENRGKRVLRFKVVS